MADSIGCSTTGTERRRRLRRRVDHLQQQYKYGNLFADTDSTTFANKPHKSPHLDPYIFGLSFIFITLLVLMIAILFDGFLPRMETEKTKSSDTHGFSADRAFDYLKRLSAIGARVVGTHENEIVAVEFLRQQIENIIRTSDRNIILCYENIQNIAVKVQTMDGESRSTMTKQNTILINCHFDSVYTSPGASDDGLHCAVMLEILHTLASADKSLKKNIIFLFNGAEEDGLLASHGFITRHRWARNVICFINLEACGAGGREILFQTGPMAYILPKLYSISVPYPHGNVIGEELFQSGLLPSDTDFRIFRDFGSLKGLDFAHYKNGYVYHTENDDISQISGNVIHHTGKNIYALLNALITESNLLEKIASANQAVYFDVFGRYMICYSIFTSVIINLSALVFSIYSIWRVIDNLYKCDPRLTVTTVAYYCLVNVSRLIIGIFVAYCILSSLSTLLRWRNITMLWYSNQWFVASYYGMPTLFCAIFCIIFGQNTDVNTGRTLNEEQVTELFVVVIQTIITLLVFGGTLFNARVTYILVILLVPLSVSTLLRSTIWMQNKCAKTKVITHVVCNLIASVYVVYVAVQLFSLLIPIMGRFGSHNDSEKLIRCLCLLVTYGIFLAHIPFTNLVAHPRKVMLPVTICYMLYVIFVLFVSSSSAFTRQTPQRISIMHVHRKYFDPRSSRGDNFIVENSGYLLTPMDIQAPYTFDLLLKDGDVDFKLVGKICGTELYCALPAMFPYLMNFVKSSYWVDAPSPTFPAPHQHKQLEFDTSVKGDFKIYNISIEGAALADFVILPLNGTRLVAWSLHDGPINTSSSWLDNKTYLIRRSRGLKIDNKWSFWLKFDVSNATKGDDVFRLSWSSHYRLNNTRHYTNDFRHFLRKFPSWTRVVSWVVDYEEYSFK